MQVQPTSTAQLAVEALQGQTQQKIGIAVLRTQAQSEQAIAAMISEQAAQIASLGYNNSGKLVAASTSAGIDFKA